MSGTCPLPSSIMAIVINLFRRSERSLNIFFWASIMVSACMTYYISLAWALLEPICGHLWINYVIQAVVNIIIIVLIGAHIEGYGHRDGKEHEVEEIEIP